MFFAQVTKSLTMQVFIASILVGVSFAGPVSERGERTFSAVRSMMQQPGSQFKIEEVVEGKASESEPAYRIYKGFFKFSAQKHPMYFEYRVPENYRGIDAVESAGFTKDSSFWEKPNQVAEFLKNGYGILTFDGLVRGRSLEAIPAEERLPSVITTQNEARVLKKLVEALGIKRAVSIGHSRGAGIAARFSKLILNENGPRSQQPIQLVAHYDLNGLVSYVSATFPVNTFAPVSDLNSGYVNENFERLMPDGSIQHFNIRKPTDYFKELVSQWTEFEKEYMQKSEKYRATFISETNAETWGDADNLDPQAKEISTDLFKELKLKFPLLIQRSDLMQEAGERFAVSSMVHDSSVGKRRDSESLYSMMRGLRTAFYVRDGMIARKFFIPHSVLPALTEIAKAGVPVIVLYASEDSIVRPHHVALKLAALQDISTVRIIKDAGGFAGAAKPHFGPERKVWGDVLAPLIRAHVQAVACSRAQR